MHEAKETSRLHAGEMHYRVDTSIAMTAARPGAEWG
jgi:hypothetical protein